MVEVEDINLKFNSNAKALEKDLKRTTGLFNQMSVGLTRGKRAMQQNVNTANQYSETLADIQRRQQTHAQTVQEASKAGRTYTKKYAHAQRQLGKLNQELVNTRHNFQGATHEATEFSGVLLSLLFFGMQLQRTMNRALTGMFDTYKKIIPENHKWNKETTKLNAAWSFFKFQIADALANSDFIGFMIKQTIKFLNWFSQLPGWVRRFVGFLMIGLSVLGSMLFFIGVMGLGVQALVVGFQTLAAIKLAGLIKSMKSLFFWEWTVMFSKAGWIKMGKAIKNVGSNTLSGLIGAMKTLRALTWSTLGALGLVFGMFALLALAWKWYVDKQKEQLGISTDNIYDYITIFVTAFLNGLAQIILSLLQIPAVFADIMMNSLEIIKEAAERIATMIGNAFTPGKSVGDAWKGFMDDVKNEFMNPEEYGITSALQDAKGFVSKFTLDATQALTGGDSKDATKNLRKELANNTQANKKASKIIDDTMSGLGNNIRKEDYFKKTNGGQSVEQNNTFLVDPEVMDRLQNASQGGNTKMFNDILEQAKVLDTQGR
jgi:hypothetical protein